MGGPHLTLTKLNAYRSTIEMLLKRSCLKWALGCSCEWSQGLKRLGPHPAPLSTLPLFLTFAPLWGSDPRILSWMHGCPPAPPPPLDPRLLPG